MRAATQEVPGFMRSHYNIAGAAGQTRGFCGRTRESSVPTLLSHVGSRDVVREEKPSLLEGI